MKIDGIIWLRDIADKLEFKHNVNHKNHDEGNNKIMNIYAIFSGLIGAILGAAIAVGLYWHGRYISAKRALADRLIILRHDVWWNCNDSEIFKVWDASLKEIWLLYNALSDFTPFWKRKKITKAWDVYKGINHKIMEELRYQVFDSKLPPKNKQEFLQKINPIIEVLQKSSEQTAVPDHQ